MPHCRLSVFALIGWLITGIWGVSGAAAETLSEQGTVLEDVQVELGVIDVSREIALNGDVPGATYVAAFFSNGTALKRTNSGYWLSWDGDLDTLVDNRAAVADGAIQYKVLKEDISGVILPATIMLAYRVGDQFKFGVFQIMAN